jgi:spore coat polysaccharide biosynthesis protein SpsF (cytidylyltransferase family)/aryl-alcohol dehydrogenase-like predicted oxidoreductase
MSAPRRAVVLLQARTTSSRLPAKVLLPVAGVPLAILAALRAGRDGLEVRLATSVDPSDDELARLAARRGIPVFRGSLEDPLARFVEASKDVGDDTILVRLTADNVFPDASLVRALIDTLVARGLRYLRTSSPEDGLPYGVSAEVFDAGALRAAHRDAETPFEREHVTPAIRRLFGDAVFDRYAGDDRGSRLRATIDTFDDYQRVLRVFRRVDEPIGVPWQELVRLLDELSDAPRARLPRTMRHPEMGELVLGTAQLGLSYGVANERGLPDEAEVGAILDTALAHGVTHLDTARAYGTSEARIGGHLARGDRCAFAIVTKVRPLDDGVARSSKEWALEAEASVLESLVALGASVIDTVLVHRETDLHLGGGAVRERLLDLRERGRFRALGASVQTPDEALGVLDDPELVHVQLPMNLLDRRWESFAARRAARPDVVVVARSVLLQGLLTARVPPERFPNCPGVDAAALASAMDALVAELGREDWIDLAIAFVRGEPWIDAIVLGVERADQVRDAARRFEARPLSDDERARVRASLPECPLALLDPSRWTFDDAEGRR